MANSDQHDKIPARTHAAKPQKQEPDQRIARKDPPIRQTNPDHKGLNPDHLGPGQPRKSEQ